MNALEQYIPQSDLNKQCHICHVYASLICEGCNKLMCMGHRKRRKVNGAWVSSCETCTEQIDKERAGIKPEFHVGEVVSVKRMTSTTSYTMRPVVVEATVVAVHETHVMLQFKSGSPVAYPLDSKCIKKKVEQVSGTPCLNDRGL